MKKPRNLIKSIEIWLYLQVIWLEIFYNEESSIPCTIQHSGVVFRGAVERQLRKIFVQKGMGYNSKNISAVAKSFKCRSKPNLSDSACQNSCEKKYRIGKVMCKKDQLLKESFPSSSAIKISLSRHVFLIMWIRIMINMEDIKQFRRWGPSF